MALYQAKGLCRFPALGPVLGNRDGVRATVCHGCLLGQLGERLCPESPSDSEKTCATSRQDAGQRDHCIEVLEDFSQK